MDTIRSGNAAEAAVLHSLILADIAVYLPFGGGSAFDLLAVVPPDGRLVRIQVKSGRVRRGCVLFNTWSTDHGRGRQDYKGRADVIAVYVHETERVFMVPVDVCTRFSGALRLQATRNNQQKGVRYASDYTFEQWVERLDDSSPEASPVGSLIPFPGPTSP